MGAAPAPETRCLPWALRGAWGPAPWGWTPGSFPCSLPAPVPQTRSGSSYQPTAPTVPPGPDRGDSPARQLLPSPGLLSNPPGSWHRGDKSWELEQAGLGRAEISLHQAGARIGAAGGSRVGPPRAAGPLLAAHCPVGLMLGLAPHARFSGHRGPESPGCPDVCPALQVLPQCKGAKAQPGRDALPVPGWASPPYLSCTWEQGLCPDPGCICLPRGSQPSRSRAAASGFLDVL